MKSVVGLLVMLFGIVYGVETYCDARKNGTQCYGALGGTVTFRLMDSMSEIVRYQLFINSSTKLTDGRKNNVFSNTIQNRFLFIPSNGTIKINNLSRNDSGNYTLQTFNSSGKALLQQILQLFIQAPVSSVLLDFECLSQGEMRVSCSLKGGDSPHYSWTLNGRTLTDAELLSGNNEDNNITLKQHVSGHLNCSVRNNISNAFKEERISTCGFIFINCTSINGTEISGWVYKANNTLCIEPTTDPTTITQAVGKTGTVSSTSSTNITYFNQTTSCDVPWYINNLPVIGGVLSALVIFLVVGVAIICAQRKKQKNKPTKQKEGEGDQEVTYADVRIMQQQGKQMEQRAEVEAVVEYGQVKFSKRARRSEPTVDDCMYAQVRKAR